MDQELLYIQMHHNQAGGDGGSGSRCCCSDIKLEQLYSAKATGGAISFYGGKTIHTFVQSGTFTTTQDLMKP